MGLITNRWQVAYKKKGEEIYRLIDNPKWGWCADPFLIEYNETIYLFAEIFLYHTERKGVIGYCTFDGQKWSEWTVTLDLHWHLSYPFVYVEEGDLYMCPESYQNGEVDIYRLDGFPNKWSKVKTLFCNVKYADTTMFEKDGEKYLFTFHMIKGGAVGDGGLYKIEGDKMIDMGIISKNRSGARCGGKVIKADGKLIRVAQDCEKEYGSGIIFYGIETISPEYKENEIKRVYPKDIIVKSKRKYVGLHTYNECNEIQVIDLKYRCFSPKELWGRHRVRKVFLNKFR